MKIIRYEVQATPKVNLVGKSVYHWRVFQIDPSGEFTLAQGFEYRLHKASENAHQAVKKYM